MRDLPRNQLDPARPTKALARARGDAFRLFGAFGIYGVYGGIVGG